MERKPEEQARKIKELHSHVERPQRDNDKSRTQIGESRGLRSEKVANLEKVLSIKLSLKHSLSIFSIFHLKSPDGAKNDLSGPI